MSKKTDIEWISDGFYVTLFPNNPQAEEVWNTIAKSFDDYAKFPVHMWPSIKAQIKQAGYSVRKARPVKLDYDQVARDLQALGVEL